MLRDFTWTEKYEKAMSDEHPLNTRKNKTLFPKHVLENLSKAINSKKMTIFFSIFFITKFEDGKVFFSNEKKLLKHVLKEIF